MLLANMWFQNLMRTFFHGIDKVIFNLIPDVYNFLIELARTSIITQADILDMADRIYKLLAVFMIFKVTFSLIMYVVNPDDFSDKSKGLSKLGVNIIISLSLLILTPYIFNYAYELQTYILEDNSLATLILGNKDDDSSKNAFNTAGDTMAYIVMTPFFTPNSAINGLYNCSSITVKNSENKIEFNEECSGLKNKDLTATGSSNVTLYSLAKENSKNFSLTTLKNYVTGVNNNNLGLTFRLDLATATIETNGEEVFVMDYKYLASAAIGVVTLLLLISFCMDVALRSIKLAFLQLIAPIPIISYVDPKSGKDGLFKKWYKMCFSTFLSLFVRLIALYFAVYIISRIDSLVDIIDGSYKSGAILKIFVVIGALMFAKQLPNILKGLGIKIEGADKFTLNPFKKFENEALGGKRITGTAGALTSGVIDRAARIATTPGVKGKLGALAGAPLGIAASATRGFVSNAGFKGGMETQSEINRRLRNGRLNGLSPKSSYLDYLGSKFGLDDATLERRGTIINDNDRKINEAKMVLSQSTMEDSQIVKKAQKNQSSLKAVQNKNKEVAIQGKKLKDLADDVITKKGDLELDKNRKNRIEAIDTRLASGNYTEADQKMMLESRRILTKDQWKTNRQSDEAVVKYLSENQSKATTKAYYVGSGKDALFIPAGTVIDENWVSKAKDAQGKYVKQSQTEVMEELNKGNNSGFKAKASDEVDGFVNIAKEYDYAVETANEANREYNQGKSGNDRIDCIYTDSSQIKDVSKNVGNAEKGDAITKLNTEIAKSQREIDEANERIKRTEESITVDYRDEYNHKHTYSITEAEDRNKVIRDAYDKERKRKDERRSLMKNWFNKSK